MEKTDKQRKPVAIKNLAELKRFIQPGVEFKTLSQKNHPDLVGLTRVVTTVQTVCFYSKIKDQPNSRFSTDNGGKGFRTDFAKADAYIFDGTTVKVKDTRNKDRGVIYEFEFYDREQTMQEDTNMDRKMVNFIKEQYPPGTRIRLNSMEDPYTPIAPGTEGEVDFVDDIGTIHMKWDNGRALGIVPGEDSFSVLPPKLTTLKLYMPLTADFYERREYGDLEPESTMLDGRALRGYQDQIMAELVKNRMPEETERGLMHWYHEADSVNTKVHSAVFTVEERDRKLWGVAECRIAGELSALEMDTLKEYIAGQASDGWGEHFEQWEILVDGGSELYVHLWNADDWGIQTEQERFAPKLSEGLPELRYLHPPVQEVFQRFLMRIKHIDPDMDAALTDLKAAIDNEVWQEWCDAVMACQADRSLKSILTPIVSKLSDMRVVNAELENLVFGPRKEFITMAILVLINIPLVRFINKDWYHTLVATIPGQAVIAVCLAAVFVSFAFVVKLTQPIEYRR